jgi:hypothetical protein
MPAKQRRELVMQCRAERRRMQGRCCSVVWFEDFWSQGGNYAEIKQTPRFFAQHVEYPPRADTTPMQRCECRPCRVTRKLWAHGYVKTARLAYECWVEAQGPRLWHRLPGAIPTVMRERDFRRGWTAPEGEE